MQKFHEKTRAKKNTLKTLLNIFRSYICLFSCLSFILFFSSYFWKIRNVCMSLVLCVCVRWICALFACNGFCANSCSFLYFFSVFLFDIQHRNSFSLESILFPTFPLVIILFNKIKHILKHDGNFFPFWLTNLPLLLFAQFLTFLSKKKHSYFFYCYQFFVIISANFCLVQSFVCFYSYTANKLNEPSDEKRKWRLLSFKKFLHFLCMKNIFFWSKKETIKLYKV